MGQMTSPQVMSPNMSSSLTAMASSKIHTKSKWAFNSPSSSRLTVYPWGRDWNKDLDIHCVPLFNKLKEFQQHWQFHVCLPFGSPSYCWVRYLGQIGPPCGKVKAIKTVTAHPVQIRAHRHIDVYTDINKQPPSRHYANSSDLHGY